MGIVFTFRFIFTLNMNDFIENLVLQLKQIKEPESNLDIVSLKMVRDLKLKDKDVSLNIHLPGADYRHKDDLHMQLLNLFAANLPDYNLHLHFVNKMSYAEAPNLVSPQIKNIIAVASGKGGVGKSTVSVCLAAALKSSGYKVGLMDADLYGPSIPTMLGISSIKPRVVQEGSSPKLVPIEINGLHTVSIGNIIDAEQAVVLRGPRLAAIIKQFFHDTAWPELDYLIVDLPPGTGDVQLTLVQTIPLTGAVIITSPQEVAYVDALKAANMFLMDQIAVPILGVVENMSWFEPEGSSGKKYFIFGSGGGQRLADKIQSSLLGQIKIQESVRELLDHGKAFELDPGFMEIITEIANKLIHKIDIRNLIYNETKIVRPQ